MDGPDGDWPAGTFDLQGTFPQVLGNVYLWQGLFSDTLPQYLNLSRALGQLGPASYVHVDCDIYSGRQSGRKPASLDHSLSKTSAKHVAAGARDILQLLTHRIQVGTVILFDDLVNYAAYRRGELKAMWEW